MIHLEVFLGKVLLQVVKDICLAWLGISSLSFLAFSVFYFAIEHLEGKQDLNWQVWFLRYLCNVKEIPLWEGKWANSREYACPLKLIWLWVYTVLQINFVLPWQLPVGIRTVVRKGGESKHHSFSITQIAPATWSLWFFIYFWTLIPSHFNHHC